MKPHYYFESSRLYVTFPMLDDFEKLCEIQSNPETMRFFDSVRDREKIREVMTYMFEQKKHNLGYGLVYQKKRIFLLVWRVLID